MQVAGVLTVDVIFAVAVTDAKVVYTGIKFEISDGEIKLIAVDGFRMAIRKEKELKILYRQHFKLLKYQLGRRDSNPRLRARSGFGSGAPLEPHSLPKPVRIPFIKA